MNQQPSYRNAFIVALSIHFFLAAMLFFESMHSDSSVQKSAQNTPGLVLPLQKNTRKPEIVNAVSIDNSEVLAAVHRIKQARLEQHNAEQLRQKHLAQEVEKAKEATRKEQRNLEKIREQAQTIAVARKKQIAEEKKRLQALNNKKIAENKQIEALKKQRQQLEKEQQLAETKALALKKTQLDKQLAEEKIEAQKKKDLEQEQAREHAAQQAQMAVEINKYKALIINAISQRWIVPENADKNLSSQFRIRLAPTGEVQNVVLIRSSGDSLLDRSAQTAIYKASPLPVPSEPKAFALFREISLTVRPENRKG